MGGGMAGWLGEVLEILRRKAVAKTAAGIFGEPLQWCFFSCWLLTLKHPRFVVVMPSKGPNGVIPPLLRARHCWLPRGALFPFPVNCEPYMRASRISFSLVVNLASVEPLIPSGPADVK